MRQILFVDDEQMILDGLRRMLRPMRDVWETEFANGGAMALEILACQEFDVIVSDMRMPGMDGAQLLSAVQQLYPNIIRVILSGHTEKEMILRTVGIAQQYLSKPCDADTLKETIAKAFALRDLLSSPSLQKLVSSLGSLPSLPSLYMQLVKELQNPNASLNYIGEIISKDIGMTAKILQMVNSAFFGLRRNVSSPTEATLLLGLDTIMSLVLSIQVFSSFEHVDCPEFSTQHLWTHSTEVGMTAKAFAKVAQKDASKLADDTMTAGLLHDTGKLVLISSRADDYKKVMKLTKTENISLIEAERFVFGATHAEIGAYLLGLWGLPDSVVEAVAFHHDPLDSPSCSFGPLTAVYLANLLQEYKHNESISHFIRNNEQASKYFSQINMTDKAIEMSEVHLRMSKERSQEPV